MAPVQHAPQKRWDGTRRTSLFKRSNAPCNAAAAADDDDDDVSNDDGNDV